MKKSLPILLFVLSLIAAACGTSEPTAEPTIEPTAAERAEPSTPETPEPAPIAVNDDPPVDPGNAETVRMWIGAELVDCIGVVPQQCLQVRFAEGGQVEWFYDEIVGYTHTVGTAAVLDVIVTDVEDAPADGSSLAYQLVSIVEQTPGAADAAVAQLAGTTWELIGFADGDLFDAPTVQHVPTIVFEGDQIRGFSGCHDYTTNTVIENTSIVIDLLELDGELCPESDMDFESKFLTLLELAETIEVTFDGRLILAPASGLTLVFRATEI